MPGDDRTEELRLLKDIARWTREMALPTVRARVERLVDTDPKKRAYSAMAAGTSTMTAIESTSGANHADVRTWLKEWEAEEIAEPDASPPRALFPLAELGIAAPPAKVARSRKAAKE